MLASRSTTRYLTAVALAIACGAAITAGPVAQAATTDAGSEPVFPAADSAWLKEGVFPNLQLLQAVGPGMTKDQMYADLGRPHFSEGLFAVREWNYILNFRTGKGNEYVSCQYQVRFDDQERVKSTHWKTPECAELANPKAAERPALVPTAAVPVQKVTLGADGLFRFGGSKVTDMLPEGRQKVERLAGEIRGNFRLIEGITVTGHADRLGSRDYNFALSLARAQAVRELFVRQGIDGRLVTAQGVGELQPVTTDCQGAVHTPALEQCLQPDRRVEVSVAGFQ